MIEEVTKSDKRSKKPKLGPLVTVISKLLFIRSQRMSALAKVAGIRLRLAGVSKGTLNIMNRTCDCVSYGTTTNLLDNYAKNCTT